MTSRRPEKKAGPRTEFAWFVNVGIQAYQRRRQLPTLELVQAEIATNIAIGVRTLQGWRSRQLPGRYEDLLHFAQLCLKTAPDLDRRWVLELFRTANLSAYTEQALTALGLDEPPVLSGEATHGPATTLREYCIRPDAMFQRVRLQEFVGREWLTAQVDAFLNEPGQRSGALIVHGPVGVGKTTFLAHLVQQRRYVQIFGEQVPGEANVSRAMRSLMAQLITRYQIEPYCQCQTFPEALPSDDVSLDRVLRAAASRLKPDERIVIVCDALNEVGTVPGGNVLGLPAVLPDGVYLILSHGLLPIRLNFEFTPQTIWLDPEGNENRRDLQTYLQLAIQHPNLTAWCNGQQASPDACVRKLLERSGGSWLYMSHLIAELRRGHRGQQFPHQLPTSLANHYAAYAAHWRDSNRTKWDALYAPLFTTLAAAREPISLDQLVEWAGVTAPRSEVKHLLREAWRPFIFENVHPQVGTVYAVYHHSLRAFAAGQVDRSSLSIASLHVINDLAAHTVQAHRRIAQYCRAQSEGDGSKLKDHEYAGRYLAEHLEHAQTRPTAPLLGYRETRIVSKLVPA